MTAKAKLDKAVSRVVKAKRKFMEVGEALEIVYQLADQNSISSEDAAGDEELQAEAERQQDALNTVHDLIVNHYGRD